MISKRSLPIGDIEYISGLGEERQTLGGLKKEWRGSVSVPLFQFLFIDRHLLL